MIFEIRNQKFSFWRLPFRFDKKKMKLEKFQFWTRFNIEYLSYVKILNFKYFSGNSNSQPTAAANAALAAAQWSHQGRQGIASQYGHDDIERMAEYSASLYAKTASEKAHYLEYYRNYYKNGGGNQNNDSNSKPQTSPLVEKPKEQNKVTVNGIEYTRYRKYMNASALICQLTLKRALIVQRLIFC